MSKTKVKILLWLLISLVAGAAALGTVYAIANLLLYFEQGADPASALNIVPNTPPDWPVAITWLPDADDTGRELEPFTREQIQAAYVRAWLQLTFAYDKGEPIGLKTYFVGPALQSVTAAVASAQQIAIAQVATGHQLKLHLYSADGSIAAFTDVQADVVQVVRDAAGNTQLAVETQAAYDVVMFLEDGNWRVRHWVRRDSDAPKIAALRPAAEPPTPIDPNWLATAEGNKLKLAGQPYHIAGLNYYPQATPWDLFWSEYNGKIIDDDLQQMRALGLNTVRIFIPYEQFGADKLDLVMVSRLRDFLNVAYRHEMRVIVTLFDFRTDYNLLTWPKADRHLERLLTTFQRHPAILAWDLKNEPDLDYAANSAPLVDLWLAHAAAQARLADPHHMITIGWARAENAATLADVVDFVSFHDYAPPAGFADRYGALRTAVGPQKPIALTEFGLPTWNSFFFPNGHTLPEQAVYYADLLTALRQTDSAGYLAWTLYDFSAVPSTVAGRWPWQRGPQRQMGLITAAGSPKPAATLINPAADLSAVARPAPWTRFFKPFWLSVLAGLVTAVVVMGRIAGLWLVGVRPWDLLRRFLRRFLGRIPRRFLRRFLRRLLPWNWWR